MSSRTWLAVALSASLLAGCKQWKAPEKIAELEARVDELSDALSAMKGKPIGKKKVAKPKDEAGEEDAEGEEKAEGDEPEAEDGDEEKAEKPAKKSAKKDDGDEAAPADDKHADEKHADKDDHEGDKTASAAKEKEKPAVEEKASAPAQEAAAKDAPALRPDVANAAKKALHGHPHWGYEGEAGPEHWGELDEDWGTCKSGVAQSPIDVLPQAGRASDIVFVYAPTKARVVDNGHTLQVDLDPGNTIFIDGHRYDLVQFHVHTPSEHTIAGERYPLEVHLVHKDKDGKLAVIGVLYDLGEASSLLDTVWRKWPAKTNEGKAIGKIDPTRLLPDSRGVYRYQGSLTTPPCTEGVVWNVMRRTRTDSPAHLALVKKHFAANARPVQPLRKRTVE